MFVYEINNSVWVIFSIPEITFMNVFGLHTWSIYFEVCISLLTKLLEK